MKNSLLVGLSSAVIVVQLAVPLSMIIKREVTLKEGIEFRFKTAPVDPFDAFRGRYVALRVDVNQVPTQETLSYQKNVYAALMVDEQGYAKIMSVSSQKPKNVPYVMATVGYQSGGLVNVHLPFDRYYMNEKSAPRAESLYREHNFNRQGQPADAYITVRVKDGFSVIDGLYLGGKKIEELIKIKT